jgi:uncharacterized protein YpuA (DUF1002 family)
MEKIWLEYINGNLSLSARVKEVYALEHNFKPEWLDMTSETIEEYVNRLLSELESEGYDLDTTPVEILQQKFVEEAITVNAPLPYIKLSAALSSLKKQIKENIENKQPDWIISRLIEVKESIEQELKSMK